MQKKKRWGKVSAAREEVKEKDAVVRQDENVAVHLNASMEMRTRELFSPSNFLNASTKKDLAEIMSSTQCQMFTPLLLLRDIEFVNKCCLYIPAFFSERCWYDALLEELGPWEMSPYKRSVHPACVTETKMKQSPAYLAIVKRLQGRFPSLVIGYSIVNWYRDENDWTEMHRDNFGAGGNRFVGGPFGDENARPHNIAIGASFGDERELRFHHLKSEAEFSFPQREGDIFAFTSPVNTAFQHAVLKANRRVSGRISVILWGHVDSEEIT